VQLDNSIVYLNGRFLPLSEAKVSVMDRGFLFGDGVYEVIPVYGGQPLRLAEHLARLANSLAAIRMQPPLTAEDWAAIFARLIQGGHDQSIYLQITRGAAPKRDHAIPPGIEPTVFAMCTPITPLPTEGIRAVTVNDIRWLRCDIKAITLLANVLLKQEAIDAGTTEAVLIRDGYAVEGAASNLFALVDGTLVTPPKGRELLPGVTRDLVLELALEHGVAAVERPITLTELKAAQEVWLTSSTREIMPVIELDGAPVGTGAPGALWERVQGYYRAYKEALRGDS
jgi:D-alanine transaminase